MDELKNVLARYREIGGRLHLPSDKLEEIRGQSSTNSTAACMEVVIVEWLKRNYNERYGPPTWSALVKAVSHPAGGNNKAEAEKIANRHKKITASKLYCPYYVLNYLFFFFSQLSLRSCG